jgi:hypothetical protein
MFKYHFRPFIPGLDPAWIESRAIPAGVSGESAMVISGNFLCSSAEVSVFGSYTMIDSKSTV